MYAVCPHGVNEKSSTASFGASQSLNNTLNKTTSLLIYLQISTSVLDFFVKVPSGVFMIPSSFNISEVISLLVFRPVSLVYFSYSLLSRQVLAVSPDPFNSSISSAASCTDGIGIFSAELNNFNYLNVFLLISYMCERLFSPNGPVQVTLADRLVLVALRSRKCINQFAEIYFFSSYIYLSIVEIVWWVCLNLSDFSCLLNFGVFSTATCRRCIGCLIVSDS